MEKTWIRRIFTDHGQFNFFIRREGYGGPIISVTEVRDIGTNKEAQIPLKIKDDELLKRYIDTTKGDNGIE